MSRNKESAIRMVEMIGAGSFIASLFQDHALLGAVVTVFSWAIIVVLNGGKDD